MEECKEEKQQKIWKSLEFQFTDEEKKLFLSLIPYFDNKRNLVLQEAIRQILSENGYTDIEV